MTSTLSFVVMVASVSIARDVTANFQELVCLQYAAVCGLPVQQAETQPRVGKAGPRGVAGPVGPPGIVNMTAVANLIDQKIASAFERRQEGCQYVRFVFSELRNETGDVFRIYPSTIGLSSMLVYCDMKTDGGGWTVIQRRMDGSEDFFKGWDDYVNGFGDLRREFWLGLETLYKFTKNMPVELRIDMKKKDGTQIYAKYSEFKVGPASDNYRLMVGGYSGNSNDFFTQHSNFQFSTNDADNDIYNYCVSINDIGFHGPSDR